MAWQTVSLEEYLNLQSADCKVMDTEMVPTEKFSRTLEVTLSLHGKKYLKHKLTPAMTVKEMVFWRWI